MLVTQFSFNGWFDSLNLSDWKSWRDCLIDIFEDDNDDTTFLRAIWSTTGPLRMLLNIAMASPWLSPCKMDPLTARISSPKKLIEYKFDKQ